MVSSVSCKPVREEMSRLARRSSPSSSSLRLSVRKVSRRAPAWVSAVAATFARLWSRRRSPRSSGRGWARETINAPSCWSATRRGMVTLSSETMGHSPRAMDAFAPSMTVSTPASMRRNSASSATVSSPSSRLVSAARALMRSSPASSRASSMRVIIRCAYRVNQTFTTKKRRTEVAQTLSESSCSSPSLLLGGERRYRASGARASMSSGYCSASRPRSPVRMRMTSSTG